MFVSIMPSVRRKLVAAILALASLLALTPAPASAHDPQRGWYDCYVNLNYLYYSGSIKLLKDNQYKALGSDTVGKYKISRHHKVKFTSGSYEGWSGKYVLYDEEDGSYVLNLYDNGEYITTCAHR